MKPSPLVLGLALQQLLVQQGITLDVLAHQMQMNPDSLSNIIHARRRFRDVTLEKLAKTEVCQKADLSLRRLKALRALDDYPVDVLALAITEAIRLDKLAGLSEELLTQLSNELTLKEPDRLAQQGVA